MPDLSFAAFNPRSFEQFAQALAAEVLGPGIMVFGDGPDGGREASHTGTLPYPNDVERWRGHVVMQAKFRQREESRSDGEWLARQLEAELKAYADVGKGRKLPDYYVLVSNVRLSSIEGTRRKGGQQKVEEVFQRLGRPLGIKDMHVWHADKIAVLLDGAPDLLRSYDGWLGPRELLSAAFGYFKSRSPDFGETMTRYLQRELRSQRATRLQQAGHVGEDAAFLEDLFVDLPCAGEALEQHDRELVATDPDPAAIAKAPLALATLLDRFAVKLAPSALHARKEGDARSPAPSRQILIGGPGQGKSTVAQFAGQIMRWRLLADDPRLSPDVSAILQSVGRGAARLNIPREGVRRYPVRVDLPGFADALGRAAADGRRLSLLTHMADNVGMVADARIEPEDLRGWLAAFPWLLTLDGLDEVPDSGNRVDVLRAINEFWDEAVPLDADVALVITTRPQGYNDDLDPRHHLKLELTRLDGERALAYGERLASLRLVEPERRERVLARLREAVQNTTTSLLTVSPLQVAILFQIIDQRGQAPTDRWTLFDGYLDVVMKREQEKPGPGGEVVRRRGRSILKLLREAGLLLHVDAERDGAASSFVTPAQLLDLVSDILLDEGHDPDAVGVIAGEILRAATDRLVFLEQREEGRIAFEVRSLQEYAAAAALMSGADRLIQERLRTIAGQVHWQHVYRIAASKAFSHPDAELFRDTILATNRGLDDEDASSRASCRGALTSLELLEDGLAADQPRYRVQLARHAMDALKLGPEGTGTSLVDVLFELGEPFAKSELQGRLASGNRHERLAAWRVLVELVDRQAAWADDLALRAWPDEQSKVAEVLACGAAPHAGARLFDRYGEAVANADLTVLAAEFSRRDRASDRRGTRAIREAFPGLSTFAKGGSLESSLEIGIFNPNTDLRFLLPPFEAAAQAKWLNQEPTSRWSVAALVRGFLAAPGAETLAELAGMLNDPGRLGGLLALPLPWPVDTLVHLVDAGADPAELIQRAARGAFGRADDWRLAEARLETAGLQDADLAMWATGMHFDERIATVGAPHFRTISRDHKRPADLSWLSRLAASAAAMSPGAPRNLIRFAVERTVMDYGADPGPPEVLLQLYDDQHGSPIRPELLEMIEPEDVTRPDVLAWLDRKGVEGLYGLAAGRATSAVQEVALSLAAAARSPGFLPLAVAILGSTPKELVERAPELRRHASKEVQSGSRSVRESAMILLALSGALDPSVVAQTILSAADDSLERHVVFNLAESGMLRDDAAAAVLASATAVFDEHDPGIRTRALRALRQRRNGQRSGLARGATWNGVGLPARLHERLREHLGDQR
ncbi:NACHT domain-containing protein [Sphingomonas corticis]|uniref:ATP-binding protein n=1 Tax=Sphingomonas corticis TaxID=2722791 RepID=A0ABX1CUD4_9SPHN|nr:hypothetical protein [Sphingomonas corticis]NJR80017.1 hypothetical protein [Sphingomonas corticis]